MKFYSVFLLVFFSSAVFAQQKCDSLPKNVSADTFRVMLDRHDGILIDLRTPEEWKTGYIAGAINIDYRSADFKDKISRLDKNKTYYVYCEIGGRSAMAADYMKSSGFCTVIVLQRGLRDWKGKKYPVVLPPQK